MSELQATYSTADIAQALDVSQDFVRRRCASRTWPHLRIGRAIRFTAEHYADIVKRTEVSTAPASAAQSWGRRTRRSA